MSTTFFFATRDSDRIGSVRHLSIQLKITPKSIMQMVSAAKSARVLASDALYLENCFVGVIESTGS